MKNVRLRYDTEQLAYELNKAIDTSIQAHGSTQTAITLDKYGIRIKCLYESFCDLCITDIFKAENLIIELYNLQLPSTIN